MMKTVLKILLWLLAAFFVLLIGAIGFIWFKSPGITPPFDNAPNSIASIEKYDLNGEEQYVILRGRDQSNPVVLFLHGGPGSPEYPAFYEYNRALEDDLTFAHWEQRGSGLSYNTDVDMSKVTLSQMVADGISLSEKLVERFGKQKIYLLGHSWGTMLGMHMIKERPDLFHAFFAVGQVSNQRLGEQISYDWVLDRAQADGNEKAVEELSMLDPVMAVDDPKYMDYIMTERKWVDHYGGSFKRGGVVLEIAKLLMLSPEYNLSSKFNYMNANMKVLQALWPTVLSNNLFETVPEVEVPVYIFQGRYDYQTPHPLAKEYFDSLRAPTKEFFTFENSAHGVMYEEPERFNELLLELVER